MRGRFSGMNESGSRGILGDLEGSKDFGGPGPTSVAREDHVCDGRILRRGVRGVNSILVKIE
jgi:hypothetical protein